jgi:hypothetical protein
MMTGGGADDAASVFTDGKVCSFADDAGVSIGGGAIEGVGDSTDEGARSARDIDNAEDGSGNGAKMSSGGAVSFIEGAIEGSFTSPSILFISSNWTAGTAAAADAVAGEVANAVVGMSVGAKMFLDDGVLDTGDVGGANFSSHLVTFVLSGGVVPAGDATDMVTGASRFGMSDDAVFDTSGVISADFFSLSVLFAASGLVVLAAAAAGVGVLAGSATDAVVSKLVKTEMFLDSADSDTGGVGDAGSLLLVLFVFPDMKVAAATCSTADSVTGALVRFEKSDGATS